MRGWARLNGTALTDGCPPSVLNAPPLNGRQVLDPLQLAERQRTVDVGPHQVFPVAQLLFRQAKRQAVGETLEERHRQGDGEEEKGEKEEKEEVNKQHCKIKT